MPENDELREKLLLSLKALAEFGEHLSSGEGLDKISRTLLHHILGIIIASKGAIFLYDPVTSLFKLIAGRGVELTGGIRVSEEEAKALLVYNLPFSIGDPPGSLSSFFEREKETFSRLQSHIVAPLIVRGELIGLLSIGVKFMGASYAESDYDLMMVIANHLALGLYNFRLVSELKELNFELNKRVLELETLYDLGLTIASLRELSTLEEEVLIRAVGLLDAKAGLLVVKADEEGYWVGAKFGVSGLKEGEYLPSEGMLAEVERSRSPLIFEGDGQINKWLPGKKFMAVPMKVSDKFLGTIIVADKESRIINKEMDFSEGDERLLLSFANQAAVALENAELYQKSLEKERMEKELEMAAEIQRSILPRESPDIPGLEIEAITKACCYVGGDYYDLIPLADHRIAIAIADVSGKGMPAALLVSTLHAALRVQIDFLPDITLLTSSLNNVISESSTPEKFITFFLSVLDLKVGKLYSVNAGHCYPRLIRAGGKVEELKKGGFLLGIFPDVKYEMEEKKLCPGDLVILYSDGVTEATDSSDEEYGEERLLSLVRRERGLPLKKLKEKIIDDILFFTGDKPFSDDLTLVLVRVQGDG
jgi:sigma-B regulation protein RsbU (phosphoserine phosphatase)